jgi:hypothetical protein
MAVNSLFSCSNKRMKDQDSERALACIRLKWTVDRGIIVLKYLQMNWDRCIASIKNRKKEKTIAKRKDETCHKEKQPTS